MFQSLWVTKWIHEWISLNQKAFSFPASNLILLNLWGQKTAPIQGVHMCWSLGWAIGPFIIRPFLGPDLIHFTSANNETNKLPSVNASTLDDADLFTGESRIEIAYMIASVLVFTSCVGCFISYVKGLPKGLVLHMKPVESFKSMLTCRKRTDPDYKFAVFILVCFCLYYFLNACEDNFIGMWLVTYAIEGDLHFTKKQAALLDGASKFSHLVGRICASLIAIKVKVQIMIFIVVRLYFL